MAWMGWCGGLLVVVCALTACGSDERAPSGMKGSGGTDPQGQGGTDPQGLGGTNPQGQGGTNPQGQGGTNPQGQGGSNSQGQGGTELQGQGGTDPQGQGGWGGYGGSGGAGGDPGSAGAAGDPGAGGTGDGGTNSAPCDDGGEAECEPCGGNRVHVECDERCVCEPAHEPLKPTHDELLACDLDERCPPSVLREDPGSALWTGGACLLTAFRDRSPGKYHHSATVEDIGTFTTDYTILVGEGGRVIVVRTTTSGPDAGNLQRTYFPVWSCSFQNFEVLDACLAAGTNVSPSTTGGATAVCDSFEDWFDDCDVVENPGCPGE